MMTHTTALRIHRAHIHNLMRLTEVEVEFDPQEHLVIVGGRNEQGKTSFLDALQSAFTKGKVSDLPIHSGAKKGEEELALMDDAGALAYRIVKVFRPSGTEVSVYDAQGKQLPDARAFLDDMAANGFGFDPAAFARQCESADGRRKQFETLKQLAGLDFAVQDQQRARLFEERTAVNARVKTLQGQLEPLQPDPAAPMEEVSAADILAQIQQANASQTLVAQLRVNYNAKQQLIAQKEARQQEIEAQIRSLQAQQQAITTELITDRQELEQIRLDGCAANAAKIDPAPLEAQLATVEDTNRRVRAQRQFAETESAFRTAQAEADKLTAEIEKIDAEKTKAMAAATMPIPDLSLSEADGVVLYQGKPLSVASSAGKLRVSTAIGIAMLRQLKVIIIRDGSLLDKDSLRTIAEMAAAARVQVFMERVGAVGCSFLIENGAIADDETVLRLLNEELTAPSV